MGQSGQVNISFVLHEKTIQLPGTLTVKSAMAKLGLSRESYLFVRDNELLNDNDPLRNGEVIKIIPVISGG